jgi:NUMOD3 motif
MSKAHSGKKNVMHGKKHSKETREKISEKAEGRKNPTHSQLNKQCKGG